MAIGGGGGGGGGGRRCLMMLPLILLIGTPLVLTFNLEPRSATVYSYPSQDTKGREAYFGYAVALHHHNSDSVSRVLVGAPRANSSLHIALNITEPGAVFTCPYPADGSPTCNQLIIDPTGNDASSGKEGRYRDLKDYGLLGSALDSQPHHRHGRQATAVCAPLWKNQRDPKKVYANGACYWTHEALADDSTFKKRVPLVDRKEQIRDYVRLNAFAEMGFSVHFPQTPTTMIFGVPGYFNWTGKLLIYKDYVESHVGNERKKREAVVREEDIFDEMLTAVDGDNQVDGFLGYSLTSGMFLEAEKELYAAGAPRSMTGKGKVALFEYSNLEYVRNRARNLEGKQQGEYYGAALTAGDINNDGLTDLVVGAPLYHHKQPDEGRIYVYMSKGGTGLKGEPLYYYGRKLRMSRFGLTLASADLNMDDYQDVIVGAPWEEDGAGAVYIFMGSAEGLESPYAQLLTPKDFTPGLRGFGMAVSRGVDVDQNGYPDLAIGSILSDKAALVRTRPVAVFSASIVADPRTVPFDEESSVSVEACVQYGGHRVTPGLRIRTKIIIDYNQRQPLAVLSEHKNGSLTFEDDMQPDEPKCRTHQVTIKKDKTDPDRSIVLRFEYSIGDNSHLDFIEQAITQPSAANSTEAVVSLAKGCEEEVCKVDLNTWVTLLDSDNKSKKVILDKLNRLTIYVQNKGEHAYLPNVTISASPFVEFSKLTQDCSRHDGKIVCELSNPLKNTSEPEEVQINYRVDMSKVPENTSLATLDIKVAADGEEQAPDDNTQTLQLHFAAQAVMELHGSSMEEQVSYGHKEEDLIIVNNNRLKFNHSYILHRKGPTHLTAIEFVMDLPVSLGSQQFVRAKLGKTKFSSPFTCTWSNETLIGGTERPGGGDDKGGDEGDDDGDKVVKAGKGAEVGLQHFNCSATVVRCVQLYCRMDEWQKESESAIISVELEVDLAVLAERISVQGGADFGSNARATILGLNPLYAFNGTRQVTGKAVTHIQPLNPKGRGVPWWVILLAVLAGIVLLAVLAYGLYKSGFFKREKMEEMKAQRARLQEGPTSVSNPGAAI